VAVMLQGDVVNLTDTWPATPPWTSMFTLTDVSRDWILPPLIRGECPGRLMDASTAATWHVRVREGYGRTLRQREATNLTGRTMQHVGHRIWA
jgi:hypothetical protein